MGRYRPPAAKSSPYITAEGFRALQTESEKLRSRRREVVKHLSAAAAEGDRSENAEYLYRKKQLRELDRRIGYLQRRMPKLKVIRRPPGDSPAQVFFGATVELMDGNGDKAVYRIVGADELDPNNNGISIDSPLARALLKRRIDDEVTVNTPAGMTEYVICAIDY
ncbi:MAG: transcription elongation factor GreB [Gammaproteobacteria bacterium]|nr:transcription elongation factor GreB [Gammaproteobacteria bacterium]